MSDLEGCVELGPVGDISLLEDCFGSLGVFVQSICLRAKSQIGDDDVAASLEQAEGEGERDAAAATSDYRSLAIEIVEGHVGIFNWCSEIAVML